jgi:hypothetical protein
MIYKIHTSFSDKRKEEEEGIMIGGKRRKENTCR